MIHGIVGGGDEGDIVLVHGLCCPRDRLAAGKMTVLAAGSDDRDVGVVVIDGGTQRLEFFHKHIAGGFAVVFNIGFVGEADDEYATAFDLFLLFDQCRG